MNSVSLHTALLVALLVSGTGLPGSAGPETRPSSRSGQLSVAYDQAFQLLERGKPEEALTVIDAALAKNPRNASLHNLRGLAAGQLGRVAEAEASFRKVIQLRPGAALGYANLATLHSQSGRNQEAGEEFREALKRGPRDFTALLGLGATLARIENYADALAYLERAWQARPGDFQAGYELARVFRELKRPEDAQRILAHLSPPAIAALAAKYFLLSGVIAEDRRDPESALRDYRRAYELNPGGFELYLALARASLSAPGAPSDKTLPPPPTNLNAEQHFALGLLFASRGAFAEAVPHFEATLRMEPASYSATYNLALAYKGAGKTQAAVELLDRALKEKPTAELHNLLASLEESAGNYVEAVRHFQRAVEMGPSNEPFYFDLGTEYLIHFTFGPALEVFQIGSRKFPASARQWVGMGLAHYALRQYLEAAEAFLSALEIDPSSPTAFAAWNSLPSFLAPAESEKILPRLKRLVEVHPESAEALYSYGVTLARCGLAAAKSDDLVLAQTYLERAVRRKPDFADAHLELGNLHVARNENEKAVAEFLETLRLNPRSEMAHYRLGQTYRNLNRLESAQAELARYAELSRNRRELMARSRSAIKQFILAETSTSAPREAKPPEQRSP